MQEGSRVKVLSKEKLSVSTHSLTLKNSQDIFVAGKTATHFNEWVKLTSDRWILNTVCGYSVELCQKPFQVIRPSPIECNELEMLQIEEELRRF